MENNTTTTPATFNYNGTEITLGKEHIYQSDFFRDMYKTAWDMSRRADKGEITRELADEFLAMLERIEAMHEAAVKAGF
jgi:hypothetical protein